MDQGISKTLNAGSYFLSPQDINLSGWIWGLGHYQQLLLATWIAWHMAKRQPETKGKIAFWYNHKVPLSIYKHQM